MKALFVKESYDEKLILLSLSEGSEIAFRALYDRYYNRVFTYTFKICKCVEVTEEIVHDIFVKLWADREQLVDIRSIEAFILCIAKKRSIDHIRKVAREVVALTTYTQTAEVSHNGSEERLNVRELIRTLNEAIKSLSSQKQIVFRLSKLEGWSHEEIAGKLGLSKSTVKNHLSETSRYLRKLPE